jgi:hypothetical protein
MVVFTNTVPLIDLPTTSVSPICPPLPSPRIHPIHNHVHLVLPARLTSLSCAAKIAARGRCECTVRELVGLDTLNVVVVVHCVGGRRSVVVISLKASFRSDQKEKLKWAMEMGGRRVDVSDRRSCFRVVGNALLHRVGNRAHGK